MKFIVEGRRFSDRHAAITFASGLAETQDRSVDVEVEMEVMKTETKRSWICRMHPPGMQRPSPETVIPVRRLTAVK